VKLINILITDFFPDENQQFAVMYWRDRIEITLESQKEIKPQINLRIFKILEFLESNVSGISVIV
jgi:hypothetical protein